MSISINGAQWNKNLNQGLRINHVAFEDLFPQAKKSLFDPDSGTIKNLIPGLKDVASDFLNQLKEMENSFIQLGLVQVRGQARETNEYEKYLEPYNQDIKKLANTIVDENDTSDEKMYKIEQWVHDNIPYKFDMENYGTDEYWATPSETLRTGSGDCEDGAFLIHSLGLHAGVDSDRLRTYGGVVAWQNENGGLSAGGHGWTAYKKESDDQWTILDSSFFITDAPLDQRINMDENMKYVDDYFFVNLKNTVDTPYSNGIRNPEKHTGYDDPYKGNFLNIYA